MAVSYFDVISGTIATTFESNVKTAMDLGKIPLSSGQYEVSSVTTYWAHMISGSDLR